MKAYKIALLNLAAYYDKVLTDTQLQVYSEQLASALTEAEAQASINLYVNNPQNEFFPKPVSKLIALVKKPVETKDQAQQVTNLIRKAVANHQSTWVQGYFDSYDDDRNPVLTFYNDQNECFNNWRDAARSELGELGLAIVDQLGGWKAVCEKANAEPDGVFTAQTTKTAESVIAIAEVGKLFTAPALPATNKRLLELVEIKALGTGGNK